MENQRDILTIEADFSHLASIFMLLQKMKTSSVCFAIYKATYDLQLMARRRVVPGCRSNRRCYTYSFLSLGILVGFDVTVSFMLIIITHAPYRSFLDVHRLPVPHYVQASVYRFLGLRHLPHAQRLQTHT